MKKVEDCYNTCLRKSNNWEDNRELRMQKARIIQVPETKHHHQQPMKRN